MARYRTDDSGNSGGNEEEQTHVFSAARTITWPGVVLLAAAAVALLSMMGCGGDGDAGDGKQAAQKKAKASGKGKQAAQEKAPEPQKVTLTDHGKELAEKADSYISRLRETAAEAGTASAGQMAAAWADLYQWCSDNDLPGAAARCWYQARRSGSLNDSTRQKLGLTETVEGVPVTAEQKQFLQTLRPRVQVIDLTGSDGETTLTLPDGSTEQLSLASPVSFRVDAGITELQHSGAGGPGQSARTLPLRTLPGFTHVVRLKPRRTAPLVPAQAVGAMYQGFRQWEQANSSQKQTLLQQGVQMQQGPTVQFATDQQGNLQEISAGRARAVATASGQLAFGAGQNAITVNGLLMVPQSGDSSTWNVYAGTEQGGVRLEVRGQGRAGLASGVYYELERRFSQPMANLVATINEDLRRQIALSRMEDRRRDVELRARVKEADGEFRGAWEAENWQREQFLVARNEIRRRVKHQRRAARLSVALDRAAELDSGGRVANMWANWPRYRWALAAVLSDAAGPVLGHIRTLSSDESDGDSGRGGRGGRSGGGDGGGLDYPTECLALLPTDYAMSRVDAAWDRLDADARADVIAAVGMLDRGPAVERLSSLAAQSTQDAVVTAAYRELAEFGGESAASYLEGPGVGEKEKAAMTTARALLGRAEALDSLPGSVSGATDTALEVATKADSPMAVPVVAALEDAAGGGGGGGGAPQGGGRRGMMGKMGGMRKMGGTGKMRGMGGMGRGMQPSGAAEEEEEAPPVPSALTRLGDVPAVRELQRMVTDDGDLSVKMVQTVTDRALPLLVGPALDKIRDGNAELATAFGERRPEGAVELLKQDASSGERPAVGLALGAWGTADAIEAAAQQAGAVDVSDLVALRESWNLQAVDNTGRWEWRDGVDSAAAGDFLETAAQEGSGGQVRLAAVLMAREGGRTVPPEVLLSLASSGTVEEEAEGEDVQEQGSRGPRGMGGRGMEGGRGMTGRMGPGMGGQQQQEEPEQPWELTGNVGLRALGLYVSQAESGLSDGLQQLAADAASEAVRTRAIHIMAERNVGEARSALRTMTAGQDQEAGIRATAAEALGKTGAQQAGQVLVSLYDGAEGEAVRVGAVSGLAELCGRIGPDSALPEGARERLADEFLQMAAGSGSDNGPSTGLRAAAIRAAAHMGAFDVPQNARVLKGLEQQFGWQVPRQGGQQGGPRGRSRGRDGGGSDASQPVDIRLAVAEAASVLTGDSDFGSLADRAEGALRDEADLADAWQDRAVDLARMGKAPCLEFVGRTVDLLDLETLRHMPEIAAYVDNPSPDYYTLLARAAATGGGGAEQQQQAGMYGRGMEQQMRGMQRQQMMMQSRGRGAGGQQTEDDSFLPDPELDEPHEWPLMQWSCIEVLNEAPQQVLSAVLQQGRTGLINNARVGPVAAVYLADRIDGFNVASYLQAFFTSHGGGNARRNGVLAARRAGPEAVSDLMRALLAGQLQARSGGGGTGQRRGQSGMAAMMQAMQGRTGPGGGEEVDVTAYAARALGSMGQQSVLAEAWRRGNARIATAAAEGIAFLPADQNPVARLSALPARGGSPQAMQALSSAATTASRVALIRSSTSTTAGE